MIGKKSILGAVALLAALGASAEAQEFAREGATLGALAARAGGAIEGTIQSVVPAGDGFVATIGVVQSFKGGQAPPAIALYTRGGDSATVDLAPGEHALFLIEAGNGTMAGAAGAAAHGVPIYAIEGSWLGKIDLTTPEGLAIGNRVVEYLQTAGNAAAHRTMLVQGLSSWNPRIATDASFDLDATSGAFSTADAAAIVDALDRNRASFEDLTALVRLAGRTGSFDAIGPLLDVLEQSGSEKLIPGIADALEQTGRGTNLVTVLSSTVASSPNAALRAKCAAVLGRLGDASAIASLTTASREADAGVRLAAIDALGRLGDGAVPALEAMLLNTGRPIGERRAAVVSLAETRAGVLRLVAQTGAVSADVADWIRYVRGAPAHARMVLAR